MKCLLLAGNYAYKEEYIIKIEKLGYNVISIPDERVQLTIDLANIHTVVCNNLFLYNDIRDFKNLKIVHLTSAGKDKIPLDYIQKKKIQLYTANAVYSPPMAEWVVLKILEIYKNSKYFYKMQEQHRWEKNRNLLELSNKKVSIIGYGNVGEEIAKRLKPFGVEIIALNKKKIESEFVDKSLLIENLDEVLSISDIVIITLPLTKSTNKIINTNKINIMKDKSVLINVSRGGVIDEGSLIEALISGKFLGVALDVFDKEPLGSNQLWDFNNVIITPHNSFVSDKVNERLINEVYSNLKNH